MSCPLDDNTMPSKKNCRGCRYFDYSEGDGGDEGRIYTPICTYKKEENNS